MMKITLPERSGIDVLGVKGMLEKVMRPWSILLKSIELRELLSRTRDEWRGVIDG